MIFYLIPNILADNALHTLAPAVKEAVAACDCFLVESERNARRYISLLQTGRNIQELHLKILDKDTPKTAITAWVKQQAPEATIGVLSDAGCPGIADPGALAAQVAHELGHRVVPLVGPSSVLLALMASGLDGQHFAFCGYLPVQAEELTKQLKALEKKSKQYGETQIFIETPYRNKQLLQALCKSLSPDTRLCVAVNLTAPDEFVCTRTVKQWQQAPEPDFHKKPTVFLFLSK